MTHYQKNKGNYRLQLDDGTIVMWTPNTKALIGKKQSDVVLHLGFPKQRFWPMFEKQMWDEETENIYLAFTKKEIKEIMSFFERVAEDGE